MDDSIEKGAILIGDNKITEVGRQGEIEVEHGTRIIDAKDYEEYEEISEVQMSLDELTAGVQEAKKNKRVCAHIGNSEGALICVQAGVDSIEHGTILNEQALDAMKKAGSFYVPTLYCYWEIRKTWFQFGVRVDVWL
jgi:imidazolonepropionase-like amidohydrolase